MITSSTDIFPSVALLCILEVKLQSGHCVMALPSPISPQVQAAQGEEEGCSMPFSLPRSAEVCDRRSLQRILKGFSQPSSVRSVPVPPSSRSAFSSPCLDPEGAH